MAKQTQTITSRPKIIPQQTENRTQYFVCTYVHPESINGTFLLNGTPYIDGGKAPITIDIPYSLSANVTTGYSFGGWTVDRGAESISIADPSLPSTSVTFGNNTWDGTCVGNLNANYYPKITITSNPPGSGFVLVDGTPETTPVTFAWQDDSSGGSPHTLEANSPVSCGDGCLSAWVSWSDGGDQSHDITVPATPTTYTALFQTQYQLTLTLNGHGISTPSSGTWYDPGASVTVTIGSDGTNSSNTRFLIGTITGSGSGSYTGSSNPFTVTMNAPITESITWATQYTLTINLNGHGTNTPASGNWYNSGVGVQVTIGSDGTSNSSDTRYVYGGATGSGSGGYTGPNNPFTATMNAPIVESISWTTQYTITTNVASGSGSVSPYCPSGCSETVGSSISVTATPSSNWQFSSWSVTGASCSGGSSSNPCAFTMPSNGVTLGATFTQIQTLTTTVTTASSTSTSTTSSTSTTTTFASGTSSTVLPAITNSPVVTGTTSVTSTVTGPTAGTATTTYTSILSTSRSTSLVTSSVGQTTTQTGVTTLSTDTSTTTTSTGTAFTTTTADGTVTVAETDTFNVLLTTFFQELHQLADKFLQLIGVQPVATPVGQQVNSVVVTVLTPTTYNTKVLTTGVDSGQGSVSPPCTSSCSETVGSSQTVQANPSSGWQFSSWSTQTGISCSTNPCTFNMPNNAVTLKATFTVPTPTVEMFMVVRGGDNGIYWNQYLASSWRGWQRLPGATVVSPGAVQCGGVLYLAVQGTDDGIYFGSLTTATSAFSGWSRLPGATSSGPGLAADSSCNLYMAVRGSDNGIYLNTYTGGAWKGWSQLPGATNDSPGVAVTASTIYLAVRGTNNGIYFSRITRSGMTFNGWINVGGATLGKPGLAAVSDTEVYVTVGGTDKGIYLNRWNGAGWAGWVAPAGGATPSGPGVIVSGGKLYFMVRGTDNGIYWCSGTWGGSWSAWTRLTGATPSSPTLA